MTQEQKITKELTILKEIFLEKEFESKQQMDDIARNIITAIMILQRTNVLNNILASQYLIEIEHKRAQFIKKQNNEEYESLIINLNDDMLTKREREFLVYQKNNENRLKQIERVLTETTMHSGQNETNSEDFLPDDGYEIKKAENDKVIEREER